MAKPKEKIAIIDYDSMFTGGIEEKVKRYIAKNPGDSYQVLKASDLESLDDIDATKVIHTGGTGEPVPGERPGSLYICHSHQWKAQQEGGKVEHLADYNKGTGYMEVQDDDDVIGKQGSQVAIEKYHTLAVTEAPKNAKVIATSKQTLKDGREVETAEALRYKDGSISLQGHPGGKTPSYVIDKYLEAA
jgi:GMP synthase-like glutamine amidotransferase